MTYVSFRPLLTSAALCFLASGPIWLPEPAVSAAPVAALTVTVAPVLSELWPVMISASGEIVARQEASATSEIGGARIKEVLADVGDVVKKGTPLARLNTELVEAEREEARAQLSRLESELKRIRSLRGAGAVSVQEAENAAASAEASRARLESINARIRYAEVAAPEDGVIISRSAMAGATVQPGTELFRLIVRGELEWRAELTAAHIAKVTPGTKAELTLPDGQAAEALVRIAAPAANPQNRMTLLYADLTRKGSARAGYYASGSILLGNTPALTAPAESVVIRDGRRFVFVLGAEQRVNARMVSVGRKRGARVEITEGLQAGESVAERGAGFLSDGDTVSVVTAEPPTPAAPVSAAPSTPPAVTPANKETPPAVTTQPVTTTAAPKAAMTATPPATTQATTPIPKANPTPPARP